VILPVESIVVVPVPPKYAVYAESRVDDELRNVCRAVQLLAFAVLSEIVELLPPT
jgi:hypothetical protein